MCCRSFLFFWEKYVFINRRQSSSAKISATGQKKEGKKLIYYDELTGLPNQTFFIKKLQQAISCYPSAIIAFIGLDRFKALNRILGTKTSDRIISLVAERLKQVIRTQDTVSRLWGDEFSIVMPDVATDKNLVARQLLGVFEPPFWIDNKEVFVAASLGLSVFPDNGTKEEVLLRNAETAMYKVKKSGGRTYAFYTASLDKDPPNLMLVESHLRKALQRGEFSLHYQPQVTLETGEIVGCEALLRWNSKDLGPVSPADFIPVAEHTGLIFSIGKWVLKQSVKQIKAWQSLGFDHIHVSANLSPKQFQDPELLSTIEQTLSEEEVLPKKLEVEITESAAMLDMRQTIEILGKVRKMGVCIALDDFGTGYSSLNHLNKLPIDTIKIDQSFIRDGLKTPISRTIVNAIIQIAKSLGLRVIAEGVETREQLLFLRKLRCYGIQGYIFSRPIPNDEFTLLLATNKKINLQKGLDRMR